MEVWTQPTVVPPGVGVGPAIAPDSYWLLREGPELAYRALVDPVNARMTVKGLHFADAAACAADLLRAARAHEVGKALLYVTEGQWRALLARGFVLEGILDGFLHGAPAYLMGYVLEPDRLAADMVRADAALEAALAAPPEPPPALPPGYTLVACGPEQAAVLAAVYRTVFTSFPAPVGDPEFLTALLGSDSAIFRAVLAPDGRVASVAAAELDPEFAAAELSDCATLSACRGLGLMQVLLHALEAELDRRAVPVRFSVARATSFGMNRALAKAGFAFRGRLRCNSHIMGSHEDMHLWVQPQHPAVH